MPKTMRKTSLKIQMLAGISLNVCLDSGSQKKLPLGSDMFLPNGQNVIIWWVTRQKWHIVPQIANIWPKMFTSGNPAIWYHWNSVSTRVTRFVHFLSKNWRFWHFLKKICQISTKTSSNSPNCDILAIWAMHVWYHGIKHLI